MKHSLYFFLMIIFCFSCAKNEARRPINPKQSTTLLYETVEESKVINQLEIKKIENYTKQDTANVYINSKNGFWYTYNKQVVEELPKPISGNSVEFLYHISDLQGNIIYSEEELGIKNYKVDKEDFISALQKGIKLMKVGETITFVIPSYHAFGIAGDENKIGINQTIKSRITLLNIKK